VSEVGADEIFKAGDWPSQAPCEQTYRWINSIFDASKYTILQLCSDAVGNQRNVNDSDEFQSTNFSDKTGWLVGNWWVGIPVKARCGVLPGYCICLVTNIIYIKIQLSVRDLC